MTEKCSNGTCHDSTRTAALQRPITRATVSCFSDATSGKLVGSYRRLIKKEQPEQDVDTPGKIQNVPLVLLRVVRRALQRDEHSNQSC